MEKKWPDWSKDEKEKPVDWSKDEKAGVNKLVDLLKKNGMVGPIIGHGWRQPTDQELFGHLVVSEEELKKRENDWNNKFNDFLKGVVKPVEDQKSPTNQEWGRRGPITKEELTEEEERIRQIPVDPRLMSEDE